MREGRHRRIEDRAAAAAAAAIQTRRDSRIDPGPQLRAHSRWRLGYGRQQTGFPSPAAPAPIETTRMRLGQCNPSACAAIDLFTSRHSRPTFHSRPADKIMGLFLRRANVPHGSRRRQYDPSPQSMTSIRRAIPRATASTEV